MTIATALADALLPLAGIFSNSVLFGYAADHSQIGISRAYLIIAALAVVYLSGNLLSKVNAVTQTLLTQKIRSHVAYMFSRKATALDLADFDDPIYQNDFQRISGESEVRPMMIVSQLMIMLSSAISVAMLISLAVSWHWWFAPLMLLLSTVAVVATGRVAKESYSYYGAKHDKERRVSYIKTILTHSRCAKEVRLFHLADFFLPRMRAAADVIYEMEHRWAWRRFRLQLPMGVINSLDKPFFLAYAVYDLFRGNIDFTHFALYFQGCVSLMQAMSTFGQSFNTLDESRLYIESLIEYLRRPTTTEGRTGAVPASSGGQTGSRIEFVDLGFTYPGQTSAAIRCLDFAVPAGEFTAIIGRNGAGKSTVAKLLYGLYDPTRGKILIDGQDIATMGRRDLRRKLAPMLQDFQLYHVSIADNISLTCDKVPTSSIEHCANLTGLSSVVAQFPEGYNAVLGREYFEGYELSGGQRQLVALTRALFRPASILLLDEPTASLDVVHERRFMTELLAKHRSRAQTILLITHRIGAALHADRVILLDEGLIVEDGRPADLIAKGKGFAKLVEEFENHSSRKSCLNAQNDPKVSIYGD